MLFGSSELQESLSTNLQSLLKLGQQRSARTSGTAKPPMIADHIGSEKLASYQADPAGFIEAFDRKPWPFQEEVLRAVLKRGENGKFAHRFVVISMPRQNGKSTLSAWLGLYRLFCDPEQQEIITVANDADQAKIILNDARRIIRNNDALYRCLDDFGLTRTEIRLQDARRWIIKSATHVSSRGLRPSTVLYDELGWAKNSDLFTALAASQAAQANPLFVVTSTVGPVKGGMLWDLFEAAEREDSSEILLIHYTENLSPLITEGYLSEQRRRLPAPVFAREHQNLWGEGSDAFATEDDWLKATELGDSRVWEHPGPCSAFVDLGWVHDETAIAVAYRDGQGIAHVAALEMFQGSQTDPVHMTAVEAKIADLAYRLNIHRIEIEAPQGLQMAQQLTLTGLNAEIINPTAQSQMERWGMLYTELKAGTVHLPNDDRLRQQLLTLTIKQTPTGWKVVDVPSIHNDRALAIAGVVHLLGPGTQGDMSSLATLRTPSRWAPASGARELGAPEGWGAGRIERGRFGGKRW